MLNKINQNQRNIETKLSQNHTKMKHTDCGNKNYILIEKNGL